jgi:hypothetical protein
MLQLVGAIVLMYAVVLTAGVWATRRSRTLRAAVASTNPTRLSSERTVN